MISAEKAPLDSNLAIADFEKISHNNVSKPNQENWVYDILYNIVTFNVINSCIILFYIILYYTVC